MQKCKSSTYIKHNHYKSEGNFCNDETMINGISEASSALPLHSINNCTEYTTRTMIKQTSVDSLYRNTMILRSKTLPPKRQEKKRKNLLKENRHDIKIEEKEKKKNAAKEEKERKKLENSSIDEGWLSGPAELQIFNRDNIQSNTSSNHGKTLKDPRFHYISPSQSLEKLDLLEKRSRRRSAFTHEKEKDKDKDCLIS